MDTPPDAISNPGAATAAGAATAPDLALAETHDHDHEHQAVPSDLALRTKSLESLLVEKGLVDPAALDVLVDAYEHKIGPRNGARVIARAWTVPDLKRRLLSDGPAALKEFGYGGAQGEDTLVVENTARVHNVVVCTLCSCYPWPLLGLPPVWYKSAPYRSRTVIDPQVFSRNSGSTIRMTSECGSGTVRRNCAISSCRSAPARRRTSTDEDQLAALVTRFDDRRRKVAPPRKEPGYERRP